METLASANSAILFIARQKAWVVIMTSVFHVCCVYYGENVDEKISVLLWIM